MIKLTNIFVLCFLTIGIFAQKPTSNKRFFSENSYWNTPIGKNPVVHPKSKEWIDLLKKEASKENFGINLNEYTIPVYETDSTTPLVVVNCREFAYAKSSEGKIIKKCGQHPDFQGKPIPLPAAAVSSPGSDAHLAIVDWNKRKAWDMWSLKKDSLGNWSSFTGISYSLDGQGVFDTTYISPKIDESVHGYGPGRAAGVPIIAGLIMYDEVEAGEINHKIAGAIRFVAHHEFIFPPATWTDGALDGGIPEGSVIQLDPNLDLSKFNLLPGELAIAKALQKYGMVIVDYAGGNCIYGEGIWYKKDISWKGKVRTWGEEGGLRFIPLDCYRVLKTGTLVKKGDRKREFQLKGLAESGL